MKPTQDPDESFGAIWREVRLWFATVLMETAFGVLPEDDAAAPLRSGLRNVMNAVAEVE